MKQIFFHSKNKYVFSLLFAIVGTIFYFISNDPYFERVIFSLSSAFFIVGFILILIGALSILSNFGAFDIFSYQFKNKRPNGQNYSLYDHQQKRIEKSKGKKYNFVPYMVVGFFFLILSIIFTTIYYANINI